MDGNNIFMGLIGAGGTAGFWGMIRFVQGGLNRKVNTAFCEERSGNIIDDVKEIKDDVKELLRRIPHVSE